MDQAEKRARVSEDLLEAEVTAGVVTPAPTTRTAVDAATASAVRELLVEMAKPPKQPAKMFEALAARGINIQAITTSEIKVSILIDAAYTELAVRTLHSLYGLDKAG